MVEVGLGWTIAGRESCVDVERGGGVDALSVRDWLLMGWD